MKNKLNLFQCLYESYWDQVSREKTLISGNYAKGKAEGKAEEKYEIAIKLISQGVSIEIVMMGTGLTQEDIEKIKENRNN